MSTFIVFQHSNGVGHLTRCSALATAFRAIGPVTLLSGGPPVQGYAPPAGVDFVQLPATRWDYAPGARVTPLDPTQDAQAVDCARAAILVERLQRQRPRVVIIEYYPFAPARMGQTLQPLFEAIEALPTKPLVVCSIRTYPRLEHLDADVDPQWVNQQLRRHFDLVLHHVDGALFPRDALGAYVQAALADVPVVQTGFVRRALPAAQAQGAVQGLAPGASAGLVSGTSSGLLLTVGGGSAAGALMLERWVEAARSGAGMAVVLTLVCGPLMGESDRARVRRLRGADVHVHDQVADMDVLTAQAQAVVCLGGYNTLIEALSLGKPVLAFPSGPGADQAFQVRTFAARGLLLAGDPAMEQAQIAKLMRRLLSFKPASTIDVSGAQRSVQVVQQLLAAARGALAAA